MHLSERASQRLRLRADPLRDPVRFGARALDERLVAQLDRPVGHRARRADVATPGPSRPPRLARARVLLAPHRLHPEARVPPVRLLRIVRTVASCTEPAALD